MVMGLTMFTSCAHMSGGKSCCDKDLPKQCTQGKCKKDKSCCKNACNQCDGKKDSCKKAQCKKQKSA
jgi:hypothetical protein